MDDLTEAVARAIREANAASKLPYTDVPAMAQAAIAVALERCAMLIEVAAFRTDPASPPHEIWTHGFETAREVFATAIRAVGEHRWIKRFGLNCCQLCGIVKRRHGENKPCPGKVRVALRENRIKEPTP